MKFKRITTQNNLFENNAWENSEYVCGIDEVGRGCFCGPVVTAAIILPINSKQKKFIDSKLMTKEKRNVVYEWIKSNCFYSYSSIDHNEIDRLNILETTKLSMTKSFFQLIELLPFSHEKIKYLIVDAVKLNIPYCYKHKNLEIFNPVKGESTSISVAAASIFAKVTRDKLMEKMSKHIQNFEIEKHKGYGTKTHQNALIKNGHSVIHRETFLSSFETNKREKCEAKQQNIFKQYKLPRRFLI